MICRCGLQLGVDVFSVAVFGAMWTLVWPPVWTGGYVPELLVGLPAAEQYVCRLAGMGLEVVEPV